MRIEFVLVAIMDIHKCNTAEAPKGDVIFMGNIGIKGRQEL